MGSQNLKSLLNLPSLELAQLLNNSTYFLSIEVEQRAFIKLVISLSLSHFVNYTPRRRQVSS